MPKLIKCLIWDLDETIWEGTLVEGDDLILRPGIKDLLKELDSRGILNSIASRNQEKNATEILIKFGIHHYFVEPQINYNLKADNLFTIAKKLNIGMESLAFIDDSIFERNGIKHAAPKVMVIKAENYLQIINSPEFQVRNTTKESAQRSHYYRTEKEREDAENKFQGSRIEFLKSCRINLTLRLAEKSDIPRILELSERTNQFNSSRISLGTKDIENMINQEEYYLVIADLKDKYGTYGTIGLLILKIEKKSATIKNLMISCRVAGRGVSGAMMAISMRIAKSYSAENLLTDYRENSLNRQLGIFYTMTGFKSLGNQSENEKNLLLYDLKQQGIQDFPKWIKVNSFFYLERP